MYDRYYVNDYEIIEMTSGSLGLNTVHRSD